MKLYAWQYLKWTQRSQIKKKNCKGIIWY